MTFLWSDALWLVVVLPPLVGMYLLLLRRKVLSAVPYPLVSAMHEAMGPAQRFRRHLPPLMALLGVAALVLAVAKPAAVITAPSTRGTVILAIDVSLSMAVTDVEPTRLAAAQAAAMAFVQAQPPDVRIGIVAFGGHADVVQSPTLNRGVVVAALEELQWRQYTGLGHGLIGALLSIHPHIPIIGDYDIFGPGRRPTVADGSSSRRTHDAEQPSHRRYPVGADLSTAIILISDGQGTMGFPAMKAAKIAADHGIRVYTIGIGTPYGGTATVEGWPTIHAAFEEDTLKEIADITQGEYFHASDAGKLKKIYEKLARRAVLERKESEITAVFTAFAAVLLLSAAALSLLWCHRLA